MYFIFDFSLIKSNLCIRNITNIDTSQLVINQMLAQNRSVRPDLKFLQIDACNMSQFADGSFSAILDKATLDAVFADETESINEYVQKYWSEIDRVLRIGGRYIIVSLLQKHIIEGLLKRFALNNWMFRVVRCIEAEEKTTAESNDKSSLPVFMVIATKFQKLPSLVLEVCMAGTKMIRVNSVDEVTEAVLSVQRAALVCSGLTRSNIAGNVKNFKSYYIRILFSCHFGWKFQFGITFYSYAPFYSQT